MREITRAQRARLGIFLIVSGGILVAVLAIVAGSKLFEKMDYYTVRYKDVSVSGLEIGASVKYHGVRVGRVEEIEIDREQIEIIVVELALKHGTPIKSDCKAVPTAMSLTGIRIIEITGGSTEAELLEPDSEIQAGESAFELITGKAEAVSEKLELVLNNLAAMTDRAHRDRLFELIDNTALVLNDVHLMLDDNRDNVANTIENLESASEGLNDLVASEALRRAFANLDTTSANIKAAELGKAVAALREALEQARSTFSHIDLTLIKGRHDLLTSLEIMRESLDSFNEFARMISEDPSLLLRGTRLEEVGSRRGLTK